MTDKQKYQRRQLNRKIYEAMTYEAHLHQRAGELHQEYLDCLALIDEEHKKICLLEDKQENFYRKFFKRK